MTTHELIDKLELLTNIPVKVFVVEEVYYGDKDIDRVEYKAKGELEPYSTCYKVEQDTVFLIINDD